MTTSRSRHRPADAPISISRRWKRNCGSGSTGRCGLTRGHAVPMPPTAPTTGRCRSLSWCPDGPGRHGGGRGVPGKGRPSAVPGRWYQPGRAVHEYRRGDRLDEVLHPAGLGRRAGPYLRGGAGHCARRPQRPAGFYRPRRAPGVPTTAPTPPALPAGDLHDGECHEAIAITFFTQ